MKQQLKAKRDTVGHQIEYNTLVHATKWPLARQNLGFSTLGLREQDRDLEMVYVTSHKQRCFNQFVKLKGLALGYQVHVVDFGLCGYAVARFGQCPFQVKI